MSDFFDQIFPVIELNSRFILREVMPEDGDAIFRINNDPRIAPFLPNSYIFHERSQAVQEAHHLRDLFHQRKSIYWAIADRHDNHFIGSCGFDPWNRMHHRLELIYMLDPDYWRHGIMTLALLHIRQFAFQVMGAQRIEALVIPTNPASSKVLTKVGFKFEGTLRKYRYYKGQFTDHLIYGSLAGDKCCQRPLAQQIKRLS